MNCFSSTGRRFLHLRCFSRQGSLSMASQNATTSSTFSKPSELSYGYTHVYVCPDAGASKQVLLSTFSFDSVALTYAELQSSQKLLYGHAHIIQPIGEHRATVVWLHGRGDVGAGWAEILEDLTLQNIKWIVPTAPVQLVTALGYHCNAWFDGRPVAEGPDDLEGLDASAAHIAELLSKEAPNIKLGVGGFSQGAATSLYTTACSIIGSYSDGTDFPVKLNITVAISGWLPSEKNIEGRIHKNSKAVEQAKGYPILLCHGTDDEVVSLKLGEKSASALHSFGFSSLIFKTYKGLGHASSDAQMRDICAFCKQKLHLQG